MMKLMSRNVDKVFIDCLFKDGEDTSIHVLAQGINLTVGFHPERLVANRENISDMLNDLSDDFKSDKGGGMSFLNMCNDKEDNMWTGFHDVMDKLVCLGLAIDKLAFLMPRNLWLMLPGGMPYIVIKN